jgi:hypothetical protein
MIAGDGALELVLARAGRVATLTLAPSVAGWTLTSVTGTADDGTLRRLSNAERAPLAAELARLLGAMHAAGYAVTSTRDPGGSLAA